MADIRVEGVLGDLIELLDNYKILLAGTSLTADSDP